MRGNGRRPMRLRLFGFDVFCQDVSVTEVPAALAADDAVLQAVAQEARRLNDLVEDLTRQVAALVHALPEPVLAREPPEPVEPEPAENVLARAPPEPVEPEQAENVLARAPPEPVDLGMRGVLAPPPPPVEDEPETESEPERAEVPPPPPPRAEVPPPPPRPPLPMQAEHEFEVTPPDANSAAAPSLRPRLVRARPRNRLRQTL